MNKNPFENETETVSIRLVSSVSKPSRRGARLLLRFTGFRARRFEKFFMAVPYEGEEYDLRA